MRSLAQKSAACPPKRLPYSRLRSNSPTVYPANSKADNLSLVTLDNASVELEAVAVLGESNINSNTLVLTILLQILSSMTNALHELKTRFKALGKEIAKLANENAKLAIENAKLANENAKLANENTKHANEKA
jgi:hypothetical protein